MAQEITIERNERSAGEIVQNLVQDLGKIVRSEIQLAKTEISEKATKAAKGGSLVGAGAVAGLLCAMAAVTACISALAIVIPIWAAALVMTILLGIAAMALLSSGRTKIKSVKPVPERTTRTLREDLEWAKQHTR